MDYDEKKIFYRAGYKFEEDNEIFFLIQTEVFRQDVLKGYDLLLILRALRDRKLLKPGDGKNLARKGPDGKKRFYWVNEKILLDTLS